MKIALVSPYDWSYPGGVRNHMRSLATYLRQHGHQVTVLTAASQPVDEAGVTTVGDAIPLAINGSVARLSLPSLRLGDLSQTVVGSRYDLVHVHEPLVAPLTMMCALAAWARAIPCVGTFHAAASPATGWLYQVARPALHPVFAALTAKIAVSPIARATIAPIFPGEYHLVPNGIDLAQFQDMRRSGGDGRLTVLFLGRLEPRKGVGDLLAALPLVRQLAQAAGDPPPRFVIVGDGPERERCQEAAREHDDIHVVGAIAEAEKLAYFAGADIFCAPSVGGESQGIVLLEAMAAGVAIVAGDIAGYRSVITPEATGVLTAPHDPTQLAANLQRVLHERALRERLVAGGKQAVKRYSWEHVGREIAIVYDTARALADARSWQGMAEQAALRL